MFRVQGKNAKGAYNHLVAMAQVHRQPYGSVFRSVALIGIAAISVDSELVRQRLLPRAMYVLRKQSTGIG